MGDSEINNKYNVGSAGNAILLIKPMDLNDHAKEIYGNVNLDKLKTEFILEKDDNNYKYKIKCTEKDANSIFSNNCTIKDIDNICGTKKQEVDDDYSKIE